MVWWTTFLEEEKEINLKKEIKVKDERKVAPIFFDVKIESW